MYQPHGLVVGGIVVPGEGGILFTITANEHLKGSVLGDSMIFDNLHAKLLLFFAYGAVLNI